MTFDPALTYAAQSLSWLAVWSIAGLSARQWLARRESIDNMRHHEDQHEAMRR